MGIRSPGPGYGEVFDVLLRFVQYGDPLQEYWITMAVSFTNSPCSGAYLVKRDTESEMEGAYRAETNAVYVREFSYEYRHGRPIVSDILGKEDCLVFRSRAVVDEEGKLKSARYGKIYGPWDFVGPRGMYMGRFFFNPTTGDTNLEDLETAERSKRLQRERNAPPWEKKR